MLRLRSFNLQCLAAGALEACILRRGNGVVGNSTSKSVKLRCVFFFFT